uniref:Uncharacterized protein n=1 Tax=Anguilla anguilla TaxID=7936 RepID=A0A0E9XGY2_ANGAN
MRRVGRWLAHCAELDYEHVNLVITATGLMTPLFLHFENHNNKVRRYKSTSIFLKYS